MLDRICHELGGVDSSCPPQSPAKSTEEMSGIPAARRKAYLVITSLSSSTIPSSFSRIAFSNPASLGPIIVPPCRCEREARQAQQSLCTGLVYNSNDNVPGSRGRAPHCPHSGTRRTGGSSQRAKGRWQTCQGPWSPWSRAITRRAWLDREARATSTKCPFCGRAARGACRGGGSARGVGRATGAGFQPGLT